MGGIGTVSVETCAAKADLNGGNAFNWKSSVCFYKKCDEQSGLMPNPLSSQYDVFVIVK